MLSFFTIFLVAISLSMDSFSLAIIYGTLRLDKKTIYLLSIIVGLFHFVMPLIGNAIGQEILTRIPIAPNIVVGGIFLIIAVEMLFQDNEVWDLKKISALLIFGFTVSIDSFMVGIGISSITSNHLMSYITFAIISFLFTLFGLKFGNKLSKKFGSKATLLGAIILILLGILYIFNLLT